MRMIRDLNSILEHIDTLNELDTSNVEPLAEVVSMFAGGQEAEGGPLALPCVPTRRVRDCPHEVAMANAPESDQILFQGSQGNRKIIRDLRNPHACWFGSRRELHEYRPADH